VVDDEARDVADRVGADALLARYKNKLADHRAYIQANGTDPKEITDWVWSAS